MSDRTELGTSRRRTRAPGRDGGAPASRKYRPQCEAVEPRMLLAATLAPIGTVNSPEFQGFQVPLNGTGAANQTFAVTSSNPDVAAAVARGPFMTVNVTHTSAGGNDPTFSGALVFQLFQDLTPLTVARISELVNQGFYTNRNFHRIASGFPGANDFIVQGGSVNGSGGGNVNQPGFPFDDEFVQQLTFSGTGQLAMANSGDDTNSSQFFATTGSPQFLTYQHTIFGQLVSGADVLRQMTQVTRGGSDGTTPVTPITITSATLSDVNPNGVIHIDTTQATAGETSTVTVTATEPITGTQTSQTFTVNVTPSDPALNTRPFLQPVGNLSVGTNQPAIFKLNAVSAEPGDTLTYTVQGGIQNTTGNNPTFVPIQNATASVDSNGVVTITPTSGFTGQIQVLVGVRDQVNRGGTTLDSPTNFDTETLTLTVGGSEVNLTPIALPGTVAVASGQSNRVQLSGNSANPNSNQTVRFNLVSQPANGTISSFDPTTGSFLYVPNANFSGQDTFQYSVTDVGPPTPNLTSNPVTVTLAVGAQTVRVINGVLVVTPAPRPINDRTVNQIDVDLVGDRVRVTIDGVQQALQPRLIEVDRLVVYGAKAGDTVNVDPNLDLVATLDGGMGGVNRLNAGGGPTRLHGWFGRNFLRGGPQNDQLIGRQGRVRFLPSGGNDLLFAGKPQPKGISGQDRAPGGTFYRFVRGRLVEIPTPRSMPARTRGEGGRGQLLPSEGYPR